MTKIVSSMLFLALSLWIQPAAAYIDPGSGSAIMSAIIGIIVAIGLTIKTYWYKLKSIFTGGKKSQKLESDSAVEEEEGP